MLPGRESTMITIKIEVNGRTVGKVTAVNTARQHKDGRYEYQVSGWATNYKKGVRYTISQVMVLTQHGSSPLFVSELMEEVDKAMSAIDASVIGATIPEGIK